MRGLMFLSVVAGVFLVARAEPAQAQYHRYYGYRGFGYGGWGGYGPYGSYGPYSGYGPYMGMTPDLGAGMGMGAMASGMGNFATGLGQYQVSNAQAQLIRQQVIASYLQNQRLKLETHFKNQELLDERRKAKLAENAEHMKIVNEQLRQLHQLEAPHRLTDEQFDRMHNFIHWPYVLRTSEYDELRFTIDKLFDERSPGHSGEGSDNAVAIDKACKQMLEVVKDHIRQLEPEEYVSAKHFLASLAYEAKFSVK